MANKIFKAIKNKIIDHVPFFIILGVGLTCALFILFGTKTEEGFITLNGQPAIIEDSTKEFIKYSKEQIAAYITDESGKEIQIDVPTVEELNGEDIQEGGQGAYIYAPVDTYTNFKNYVIGKCLNTDGAYGAQCWDLGDVFWQNYAGRSFSTCGTGAAKGSWNCKEQNAGNEFTLIYSAKDIQAGDWVIFESGKFGHVGMALGKYNNGYVTLLGQNQGGASCNQGGSAANIINMNLSSFKGAFRPKSYVNPEPTPTPTPEPIAKVCSPYKVIKGDTMGKIMQYCEGKIDWSQMNTYADSWISSYTGKSVYYGWTHGSGVGLYAGDIITKR